MIESILLPNFNQLRPVFEQNHVIEHLLLRCIKRAEQKDLFLNKKSVLFKCSVH